MPDKIKLFIAEHCEPCQEIKELAAAGKIPEDMEVVDVESDEGFPLIKKLNINMVPVAYKDGEFCLVNVVGEKIDLICRPPKNPPASPEA